MSNAQQRIEELTQQIEFEKQQQQRCKHKWPTEARYDPEEKTEWLPDIAKGLLGKGSDPYYETYPSKKSVPRWSRTCETCGKTEYTYSQKTVEVIQKPVFNS